MNVERRLSVRDVAMIGLLGLASLTLGLMIADSKMKAEVRDIDIQLTRMADVDFGGDMVRYGNIQATATARGDTFENRTDNVFNEIESVAEWGFPLEAIESQVGFVSGHGFCSGAYLDEKNIPTSTGLKRTGIILTTEHCLTDENGKLIVPEDLFIMSYQGGIIRKLGMFSPTEVVGVETLINSDGENQLLMAVVIDPNNIGRSELFNPGKIGLDKIGCGGINVHKDYAMAGFTVMADEVTSIEELSYSLHWSVQQPAFIDKGFAFIKFGAGNGASGSPVLDKKGCVDLVIVGASTVDSSINEATVVASNASAEASKFADEMYKLVGNR